MEVDGRPNQTLGLRVQYFACDDELTFCIPVRQDYELHLTADMSHGWTMRTSVDGTLTPQRPEWLTGGMGMGMRAP